MVVLDHKERGGSSDVEPSQDAGGLQSVHRLLITLCHALDTMRTVHLGRSKDTNQHLGSNPLSKNGGLGSQKNGLLDFYFIIFEGAPFYYLVHC